MTGLIDYYCDAMDAVGRLTGDDLLDVSDKQLKKDDLYWWQRLYTRTYCGNNREKIVLRLNELIGQVFELVDWIMDSKYLQIQPGWVPHELTIEKIKMSTVKLKRIKASMDNFQNGLREQEQHYKKLRSPVENDFRKLFQRVDERLNQLEPAVNNLESYIKELEGKAAHSNVTLTATTTTTTSSSSAVASAENTNLSPGDVANQSLLFKDMSTASKIDAHKKQQ